MANLELPNLVALIVHNRGAFRMPVGDATTTDPAIKLVRPGTVLVARDRIFYVRANRIDFAIVRPAELHGLHGCAKLSLAIPAAAIGGFHVHNESVVEFWPHGSEDEHAEDDPPEEPVDEGILGSVGFDVEDRVERCTSSSAEIPEEGIALSAAFRELPGWTALGAPPDFPDPYYHAGNEARLNAPIYPAAAPREIWLTLEHRNAGGAVLIHDVALFTVAPFIFSCDLAVPERLFAVYVPDDEAIVDEDEQQIQTCRPGNYGFLRQLIDTAGIPVRLGSTNAVDPDQWFQDCVHLGYGHGPGGSRQYAARARRQRVRSLTGLWPLQQYGGSEFTTMWQNGIADNSQNYGGNIVTTPPIAAASDAQVAGSAGPAMPAHPAAPYGKLILCCTAQDAVRVRRPDDPFLNFLRAQCVQPLVPIDVAALKVGHADEVVSFVPSNSELGWAMLFASPDTLLEIMTNFWNLGNRQEALRRGPRVPSASFVSTPAFVALDGDLLAAYNLEAAGAAVAAKAGTTAFTNKLADVLVRLRATLNVDDAAIVRVPVAFNARDVDIDSEFPNMVNLQVAGQVLLIPKPWGPRVTIDAARTVLAGVGGLTAEGLAQIDFAPLRSETLWLAPYQDPAEVVTQWRADTYAVQESEAGAIPQPLADAMAGHNAAGWCKRVIQWNDSVCLFEAYMWAKLQPRGVTPVFLDDYHAYHVQFGDVHCGTKVARVIPDVAAQAAWWNHYDDFLGINQAF